jgi:hypothetical protein
MEPKSRVFWIGVGSIRLDSMPKLVGFGMFWDVSASGVSKKKSDWIRLMCTYPNTLVNFLSEAGQALREIQGVRLHVAHGFCVIDSAPIYRPTHVCRRRISH